MTGDEHYRAAERLMQPREVISVPMGERRKAPPSTDSVLQALTHAVLALAAETSAGARR
jgi:hypothetical protein